MKGKFCAVLVNLRLLIVIRRPCTLILLLATCTKRLRRWKNWARLSNLPPKVNVSGTLSRPGTGPPGGGRRPPARHRRAAADGQAARLARGRGGGVVGAQAA